MPQASHLPRITDLPLPPIEVAQGLRNLPGFVFLDTSSADPGSAAISIIGALPRTWHMGDIASKEDRERLRSVLNRNGEDTEVDLGFPTGGLIGSVNFDGGFCFGEYQNLLVFDHLSSQWWELGNDSLSQRIEARSLRTLGELNLRANWSEQGFEAAVRAAQEYIASGDVYQVNLSQRFSAPWPRHADPFSYYARLRDVSPAPWSAFFKSPRLVVSSSSPECFLKMSGRGIKTCPIKGTRPRFRNIEADERSAYDLLTSSKEVAELIMITDLQRNDLGQVCEFGSVEVTELMKLERFPQVFHLVSTVQGVLSEGVDHLDAFAACFPGGSISGAPKKRALEIIDELEPLPRGPYTGAIGYFGYNRESQFNIAIRTAVLEARNIHFHVGAGIVADSDPHSEYEETMHKARGLLAAAGR